MKRKNALSLLAAGLLILLCFCGCGQIEDTNGAEDKSLCSLTEEEIFSGPSSYVASVQTKVQIGNRCEYAVKKLSGALTVLSIPAEGDAMSFTYRIEVPEGNLRAVLLRDGEYVRDLTLDITGEFTLEEPEGTYELRLAGESARVEMEISWEAIDRKLPLP